MARKTKRASEIFPLVAEFKRSEMTQQAFSKKKQFAYGMFLYWLKGYNEAQKLIKLLQKQSELLEKSANDFKIALERGQYQYDNLAS